MKILLGDFNAKDILKPAIRDQTLHEISNSNVLNFATSKNLIVKSTSVFTAHKFF
jgi:hypothetical protein